MRRTILGTFAFVFFILALACSGGSSSSGSASGPSNPPPPPAPPQPLAVSHYTGTPKAQLFFGSQGTISPVFIVGPDGLTRGELDGYQHLRTSISVAADGTLQTGPDSTLTHPDGTTVPLVLTGTLINGVMSGTANGQAFSLTVNPSLDTPVTLSQAVGTYVSSVSSNGMFGRITISIPATDPGTGQIVGTAYATQADALAQTNPIGRLEGSLTYAENDPNHLHNVWNIGFAYYPAGSASQPPEITYGMASFEGTSLISLTANHINATAGQWSTIFQRQ